VEAIARLAELMQDDGWEQPWMVPPRFAPHTRINDATLGTAGNLLGAVWAHRTGTSGAAELAHRTADLLLSEGVATEHGTTWPFVPHRFTEAVRAERGDQEMPNWSHGLAGIAASLAVAGAELDRPDLVEAARSGAEHLVTLGDTSDGGFVLPHVIPPDPDQDEVTYSWCHGPTGTSLLFTALEHAGVAEVAGEPPEQWQRRCLHSIHTSGIPERLHPGFWDNDGRCCGTAGVGDVVLDAWQLRGVDDDLAFAQVLGDALVDRAVVDDEGARWRFVEHRDAEPLLPPGVGWMQGAAGIAAYLLRLARVLREGRTTPAVARLDTWWNLP
jgi:lantibiotic modifying enzyme